MIETIVLDRARPVARQVARSSHPESMMKAFTGLLLLAAAVAFLSTSCGKTLNCKCVGQLYDEDGSSQPSTIYAEFEVWPWWVLWSGDRLGKLTIESHEPAGFFRIGYFRPHPIAGDQQKYELTDLGDSTGEFNSIGIFSTLSGSLGLEMPHGNFVGNCEYYAPVRLAR